MKDTYLNAKLIQPDLIRLVVFSSLPWEKIEPSLIVDGVPTPKMKPTRINTLSSLAIADFRLEEPLELGHSYFFVMPQYGSVPLDVSDATNFEDFDQTFAYDGDDLGATYSPKETSFALWAPLASRVVLSYRKKGEEEFIPLNMVRTEHGVYRATIDGDHDGTEYHYFVTNSEVTRRVTDPYAKGSTLNGGESVVIDFAKLKTHFVRECLPVLNSPVDAVIYEAHVRDMTIDPGTDIVHKGTFKGLSEKGRKSKGGNKVGLDYLASLGITHVQLLPIYDYKTVDEANPSSGYNWGYDPAQYFVPEGSYASVLSDPYSRIKDCKDMVAAFHKEGIRVVMDVVYNHVFEYEKSVFEAVVPNYYFRHKASGKMANTSGCGDDLASERPMVRKLIVDACAFWQKEYGIDGFRFDLMGIIDCETLNIVRKSAQAIDPFFLVYGEGWNMGGEVKVPLGTMDNHRLLPGYAFFNDHFRESAKRFLCEEPYAMDAAKNIILGSCIDFMGGPRFDLASQSINYVECHDNATFFDTLAARRGDLDEKTRLKLCSLAIDFVLFSFGIPLIHMGQEFGLTKKGEDNTYNKGDDYNKFDVATYDARQAMVQNAREAIALRRKRRNLHVFDPRVIAHAVQVLDYGRSLRLRFIDPGLVAPSTSVELFFNPSADDECVPIEGNITILHGEGSVSQGEDKRLYLRVPGRGCVIAVCD